MASRRCAGDDHSLAHEELVDHSPFSAGHRDLRVSSPRSPRRRIELRASHSHATSRRERAPTNQRSDTGAKPGHGERLCDEVVGTGIQPSDPLMHLSVRSQHQDRHHHPILAERPAQLHTVAIG